MASATLERRKQQQKCLKCHQDAPLGQGCCFDCTDKMARQKQAALDAGKCINCWQQPVRPGKQTCTACAKKRSQTNKTRYSARNQEGLCVRCGKEPQWHRKKLGVTCWAKMHHV